MATTGILDGKDWLIYVDGTAVLHSQNAGIGFTTEMRDTTTKDSTGGWGEAKPGRKNMDDITLEGLVALDAAYGVDEIYTLLAAGTSVTVKFSTEVVGDTYWSVSAYIQSIAIGAPMYDNTTYNIVIKPTGQPSKLTNT